MQGDAEEETKGSAASTAERSRRIAGARGSRDSRQIRLGTEGHGGKRAFF